MSRVRGVLFDLYGTLIRWVVHPETHRAVFARHGLLREHAAWGDQWAVGPGDGELHLVHSVSREAYHAWELERLRIRTRAAGVSEERIEALVRDLYQVPDTAAFAAYQEVAEVLAELRRRDLVVAVCSNWGWELEQALARVGLADAFEVAVGSAQAGARKPHPLIYQVSLARCGLRASEALFVGDSWGPDVVGPRSLGIRAVHLCRDEPAVRGRAVPPGCPEVPRIADLRGLLPLL
ncbi:HAD family hydrolase [Kitasatospora acidiphila]|uniref:HAD family hydrolase n=1 Tax=Kitasatospora acidiphila TaxID=2567942 RepID=UPI003C7459FC